MALAMAVAVEDLPAAAREADSPLVLDALTAAETVDTAECRVVMAAATDVAKAGALFPSMDLPLATVTLDVVGPLLAIAEVAEAGFRTAATEAAVVDCLTVLPASARRGATHAAAGAAAASVGRTHRQPMLAG
jgi:hypothetical protein